MLKYIGSLSNEQTGKNIRSIIYHDKSKDDQSVVPS